MSHIDDFPIGTKVRYKPGFGTYGPVANAAAKSPDGRVGGVVRGHTEMRVQCTVDPALLKFVKRSWITVDARSLIRDDQ